MDIIGDSTQNSDDENIVNLANTNRRNRIIDSDSETDQYDPIITTNNPQNDSDNSDNEEDSKSAEEIPKNKPKRIKVVDSDSEREDSVIIPTNKAESTGNSNFNSPYHPETSNDRNKSKKPKPRRFSRKTNDHQDTDSNSNHETDPAVHKSNPNSLYDPESSDEDTRKTKPKKPRSSRKVKDSTDGPKKLKSGREAVEQRKEIAAESQRMLRESRVSLPYHVPKVHSLKEFLEKRPRLAATVNLSENVPPPLAIKMTKDQLEIVSKKLDERLREVEEFYKSDNESDTEIVDKDIEQTRVEIRNWLDTLVDTAMDSVEIQLNQEMSLECDNVEENEINRKEPKKLSKYAILAEKLANIQPKLSGSPDEIIDLETGLTRRSEIRKLVDKYIEHTIPKHLHKDKVETNVISVNGGDIREETVTLRADDDEIVPKFEIPGAKLKKLKEKLINEMAEKRSELWQQKNFTITEDKSNDKDDYEDDYLDDEEEEEFELSATSSDEDEFDPKSKNKPKCSFVDDEAEVDDEVEEIDEISENSKKLKRVIGGFNDDDTDEDVDNPIIDKPNDTQDDFVVPNVPKINQISPREKPQLELDFLTPVTFITGLQNLNSDKLQQSPIISPFKLPTQPSPLRGDKWQSNLQKKLFQEPSQQPEEEETPTTQDLLEICSGKFPDSQQQHTNKEIKQLDQDNDNLITQLLIEDDLDEFEKQLNSKNEIKPTGILDSDDENDGIDLKQQKKKKFVISDESSDDNEDNDEKQIDLHDNTGLDDDIDYDSEENEIDESNKFNVNDFVEREAELSESEWGSDDEDENNLDEMEFEQGDKEEFDENQIRSDIEKIHMRRLLDDDTREIKLLQELLLEDGELHGTGRQRQFRWRNIDTMAGDEAQNKDEDGVYLDDEETEEEWRKMRHKREMFLKQNSQNDDDNVETILQNSKILKIGQKSIRTSQSFNNSQKTIQTTENTEIIGLSIKRGSFLSRNDQVLERLAEYTKVSTNIVGTTKNSKSFVFKSTEIKRKATEETPKALKKIRLDNFSPSSSKKLF